MTAKEYSPSLISYSICHGFQADRVRLETDVPPLWKGGAVSVDYGRQACFLYNFTRPFPAGFFMGICKPR